ncbi:MAG: UDP-N-acetylmuramoyl-L-alanine--D-glutamate ligase, partial [Candidatus Hydrogenedens sp.]|nr:UDP-N-acetylmuramoyl-L-alanine--D-glutamate ligase [Candidatus Hydrogenedens sp.]
RGAAVTGCAVLLSPGCASFDLYDNFEQRGRDFKRLVRECRGAGAGEERAS